MEISAKLVKELRDKTGAGMMDCKRALIENNGDIVSSEEYLRKKGLMDAAKKSFRVAADGLIAISIGETRASIIELNSETDFVAKNEKFQKLAKEIAKVSLDSKDVIKATYPGTNHSVQDEINSLIAIVGENMSLRRFELVEGDIVSAYMHNSVADNLGKIGVLVALESSSKEVAKLVEFGRKIAMHIAAANPSFLNKERVPVSIIDKEKSIILAQAREMGKAAEIGEKMAEGRIKKFLEEVVLLEQVFVMDNKLKVQEVVENFSKEIGTDVVIKKFVKYVLGEGVEKTESSFVDEVMSFVTN